MIAAEREAEERSISDCNVVEIDAFRRRRQAEIAQQAAELEAEAIRTLAVANRDKVLGYFLCQNVRLDNESIKSLTTLKIPFSHLYCRGFGKQ